MGLIYEFYAFIKKRWLLFIAPILVATVLIVLLEIFTEDSAIAPFVYTLF